MHYVIADIHGCYNEYMEALESVRFSESDTLFVLGDIIDRGYGSVGVLRDLMSRKNVVAIMGNHEQMAVDAYEKFLMYGSRTELAPEDGYSCYDLWIKNGGGYTLEQLRRFIPEFEQRELFRYMSEMPLYKEVSVGGQDFLLVHGGLEPFEEGKAIADYDAETLLYSVVDLEKTYFKDKITITGHTPTPNLEKGNMGTIIKKNNHIALDCGCVFGFNLAIYCLETGEAKYIPSTLEKRDHSTL